MSALRMLTVSVRAEIEVLYKQTQKLYDTEKKLQDADFCRSKRFLETVRTEEKQLDLKAFHKLRGMFEDFIY